MKPAECSVVVTGGKQIIPLVPLIVAIHPDQVDNIMQAIPASPEKRRNARPFMGMALVSCTGAN